MAEVRQTFRASRIGTIAGCYVTQGKITRGAQVRLVRDGTIVYDGRIASLQALQGRRPRGRGGHRVRDRARELPDVKEGDVLEAYETQAGRADARLSVGFVCVASRSTSTSRSNGSLKGKRKELLSREGRSSHRRFGAAVAEVDHHDLWQRATLTAALVGSASAGRAASSAAAQPRRASPRSTLSRIGTRVASAACCPAEDAAYSGGLECPAEPHAQRVNEAVREVSEPASRRT